MSVAVPFLVLKFCYLNITDFRKIQREQPLELPPRPPASRIWKGSAVAPFAGNNMLVLYNCPANSSDQYFVRVLHNEEPIAMPVSILSIPKATHFLFLAHVWTSIKFPLFCHQCIKCLKLNVTTASFTGSTFIDRSIPDGELWIFISKFPLVHFSSWPITLFILQFLLIFCICLNRVVMVRIFAPSKTSR